MILQIESRRNLEVIGRNNDEVMEERARDRDVAADAEIELNDI